MKCGKVKQFYKNLTITLLTLSAFSCFVYANDITLPNPAKFEPIQIKTTADINTETSRESESRNIPASDIPVPEIINSFFAPINESANSSTVKTSTHVAATPAQIPAEPLSPLIWSDEPLLNRAEVLPASCKSHESAQDELESLPPLLREAESSAQGVGNYLPPLRETEESAQGRENYLPPLRETEESAQDFGNYLPPLLSEAEENPFKTFNTIKLPSEYKSNGYNTGVTKSGTLNNEIPSILPDNDTSFAPKAVEQEIAPEPELEGKTISKVEFKGLSRIKSTFVADILSVRAGSTFNFHRVQDDLQNIYALGYFKDNMYVEPELQPDGNIALTFVLEENILVTHAEIKGNTVFRSSELNPFVSPLEGLPQNLNLINESIGKINQYYESKGYILAKVTNVEDNADGKLIFVISEGIIEKINIEGNKKTKDYIIQRNILTGPGRVYNEEVVKKDLSKIYSTQIFEKVDREIQPSPDKEGQYILTLKVKESSSNSISLGVGVDNALGGFGSVSYNEKNLFGKNQKLSLSGMLGSGLLLSDASIKNRMNWNLELNFFEPYFKSEDNTFASKLYYRDLGSYQIPLAIERRWGWNNTIEHKVRSYDNLTTSLALGYENIHLKEGDLAKISSLYALNHIDMSKRKEQLNGGSFINIAPGIKYSTLDNESMPREGLIAKANFVESFGITDTKRTNGRFIGSITKYIPIAQKSTLLIGAKGGVKVHGKDMPEVMAFRLGGPYTVRGFKMNGVGTGESFAMASAELQTPIPYMDRLKYNFFKNLRFAFFVDAGKVFDPTISSTLFDRPLSAITAGVGLRINIPGMSTISIDYGLPLTNTGKYSSQHGYFTFGTGGLYDSY